MKKSSRIAGEKEPVTLSEEQKYIIDSCVYTMCILHNRKWDFGSDEEIAGWLLDLIVKGKEEDSRRVPGPTGTIKLLAAQPVSMNIDGEAYEVPRLLERVLHARDDVISYASKEAASKRIKPIDVINTWFYGFGIAEINLLPYIKDEAVRMVSPDEGGVPPLATTLWTIRSDLQQAFPISTLEGRKGLTEWLYSHALDEYPGLQTVIGSVLAGMTPENGAASVESSASG